MNKEDFHNYIAAFNAWDFDGFTSYYADDVLFDLSGKLVLRSRVAVRKFYQDVSQKVKEKLDVRTVVMDEEGLAADVDTEFKALVNDPSFIAGPIVPGQSIFIRSFIFYQIGNGKFTRITARRVTDARTGPPTF